MCHVVWKYGGLRASKGVLYCTSRGFDLLASLGICNYLITMNNITKQLEYIIISSTPSLKKMLYKFQAIIYGRISLYSPFLFSTLEFLVYSQFL